MIVAFDASILVYLLDENAAAPLDPDTNQPVTACRERLNHLVATLARNNGKIVVPTPALAEVLVKAGSAGPGWLRLLSGSKHFRIAGFDQRAAVECAARQAERKVGAARNPGSPRWKPKFDDQIVAIATNENATIIYSDDSDIAGLAAGRFQVIGIAALPLPPEKAQADLPFDEPAPLTEPELEPPAADPDDEQA